MPRTLAMAALVASLLLAACGEETASSHPRAPDGPWVLDAEALAESVRSQEGRDPSGLAQAAAKARRSRLELQLEADGAWKGRAVDPDGREDRLRGRWSWDEKRFELKATERNGKKAEEAALVGTYDGTRLRLEPSDAPGTLVLVFRRP